MNDPCLSCGKPQSPGCFLCEEHCKLLHYDWDVRFVMPPRPLTKRCRVGGWSAVGGKWKKVADVVSGNGGKKRG